MSINDIVMWGAALLFTGFIILLAIEHIATMSKEDRIFGTVMILSIVLGEALIMITGTTPKDVTIISIILWFVISGFLANKTAKKYATINKKF